MQKYLIIGLGNIGDKYINTRHNIGFKIADELAKNVGVQFSASNFGEVAQFKYKARPVTLLKPNTFMNLSGNAIKFWIDKEKIDLQNIIVIADDLNLPFGTIRIRTKGSDGGHNGLKSIQEKLNTTQYSRLRFGVGNEFLKGQQIDYVMGEWDEEENKNMQERLVYSVEAILAFIFQGANNAMNQYNGK